MPENESKLYVAYIKWFDSAITHGDTVTVNEAHSVIDMESVGFLVKEDDECVTIALDRCTENGGLRCTLCIPRINIVRIRMLKE